VNADYVKNTKKLLTPNTRISHFAK